jgi:hypothetical protein
VVTNVVTLNCDTTLDIPVVRVLEAAMTKDLDMVLIIGITEDGAIYIASSDGDIALNFYAMDRAKYKLLAQLEARDNE